MPQPQTTGKRGRPPGTGKNDTDRLLKIAALMAADPGLKPTTAIKRIGETDPSAIRRLRDKYNEQQALLVTGSAPTMAVCSIGLPIIQPVAVIPPAVQTLDTGANAPTVVVLEATPVASLTSVSEATCSQQCDEAEINFKPLFKPAPVQDPFVVLGKWFGNGIETAAVLFEQQMMFAQTMLKATPVKAMWRQQIVATEYLLMLSGPGQRIAAPHLSVTR
jgi:hypothetical protein